MAASWVAYILTWRDITVRYKQAALGVLWVILRPVLTPSEGESYPILSHAGLLPVELFAK